MQDRVIDCKNGPLHLIGSIQPLGALVAVDIRSGCIDCCSANIAEVVGRSPRAILGRPAADVFGAAWWALEAMAREPARCRVGEIDLPAPVTVIGHRRETHAILEFEYPTSGVPGWWDEAARIAFIERLSVTADFAGVARLLTETIAACTGYDRVMMYRFLNGWDGEVIEQHCRAGVEGFLGQRFPAGDIPENARRLYTLNWQRIIADTEIGTVDLCGSSAEADPLDLSFSILRAVHPVHIQYLRNMGVRGSFSVSLVVDGDLWGLVTCHHRTAKTLNARARLALEEMARLASLHLHNLVHLDIELRRSVLRERLAVLDRALQPAVENPGRVLPEQLGRMQDLLNADGLRLRIAGAEHRLGELPDDTAMAALDQWLHEAPAGRMTWFDTLPNALRTQPSLCTGVAGMIHLPLGRFGDLTAVRRELLQDITWAGRGGTADDSKADALTPRNSFAAWSEHVRCQSEPWGSILLEIAEALQTDLIGYLDAARDRKLAYRDPLTGLANRHAFDRGIAAAIADSARTSKSFALHMVDLDRFKPVNDTYGHGVGDALLRWLAKRMLELARRGDLVARIGGDEFAVIQVDIADRENMTAMAQRLVDALVQPMRLDGHVIQVGASVGSAVFPADAEDADALQRVADTALYAAKRDGRDAGLGGHHVQPRP